MSEGSLLPEHTVLNTAQLIYGKVVDQLIHYRASMLQLYLGTGTVFAALAGWYIALSAPTAQQSAVFGLAVLAISLVSSAAIAVLHTHVQDTLYVINGCEEMFGCWENGKFVAGRPLLPTAWRDSHSRKWAEPYVTLHYRSVAVFIVASAAAVVIQLTRPMQLG